jgi:two-component system cell cycle sensor histidine kinase PleC
MPSEKPLAKRRRLAAQRVREARERLTSTTGTSVAFDYELLPSSPRTACRLRW